MFKKLFSNPSKQQDNSRVDFSDLGIDRCNGCTDKVKAYKFLLGNSQVNTQNIKPLFTTLESCKGCRDIEDIDHFIALVANYINDFTVESTRAKIVTQLVRDATNIGSERVPDTPNFRFYLFVKAFLKLDEQINSNIYTDPRNKDLRSAITIFNGVGAAWESYLKDTSGTFKEYTNILKSRVAKARV